MIRLFRVFIPVGSLTLLISETLLLVSAFVIATYFVQDVDPGIFLLDDGGLVRILLVVACILLGIYFHDLYANIRVKSSILLLQQFVLVIGVAFLLQGLISYLDMGLRMPIKAMVAGSVIGVAAIFGWRIFFSAYAQQMVGSERLLLAGDSELLAEIGRQIEMNPDLGLEVIGYAGSGYATGTRLAGGKALGPLANVREIAETYRPNRIVVGIGQFHTAPVSDLLELRFGGYVIEEAAAVYEHICGRVHMAELRTAQLIYSGELEPRQRVLLYQRCLNLAVALGALALTLPVMLATALAVRLTSSGPVIYRHALAGLGGAPFTGYAFRAAAGGGNTASERRVSRLLQKTDVVRLPQLFNVMKGAMSIVGPSAERPEFAKALAGRIPYYNQRFCVRPGITGWAQISCGELEDAVTKLECDLYYIKNMSVSLDTYIIFQSLKTMLLPRGVR